MARRLKRDEKGLRIKSGVCAECLLPKRRLNHYGVCEDCRRAALQARRRALENAVREMNSDIGTRERIRALRPTYSFREIADFYGPHVTAADVYRMTQGEEPDRIEKREALNLPITRAVTICPKHKVVHLRKTCPRDKSGPPRLRLVAQVDAETYTRIKAEAERRGVTMADVVRERMEE